MQKVLNEKFLLNKGQILAAIDLDDCVYATYRADMRFALNTKVSKDDPRVRNTFTSDVAKQIGLSGQEYEDFYNAEKGKIISGEIIMHPMPFAVEALNAVHANGHKFVFLTAREDKNWQGECRKYAIRDLERDNIPFDEVVIGCTNKGEWCKQNGVHVLVDNSISHISSANELGVRTFIKRNPENRNYSHRLNEDFVWSEFQKKFETVIEQVYKNRKATLSILPIKNKISKQIVLSE